MTMTVPNNLQLRDVTLEDGLRCDVLIGLRTMRVDIHAHRADFLLTTSRGPGKCDDPVARPLYWTATACFVGDNASDWCAEMELAYDQGGVYCTRIVSSFEKAAAEDNDSCLEH